MEPDSLARAFGLTFQVSFLDLILSGDNALVIALACRSLPPELRRRAVLWGTGFAILLRLLLAAVTGALLSVPLLKLAGAAVLFAIAIQLLLEEHGEPDAARLSEQAGHSRQLWNAVMLVVGADLALSLDNVVALAAAAQGSLAFLLLGLLLSVPLLMYGSLLLARLMDGYPLLIPAGAAALGWLAGGLAVGDALWGDWVAAQAPALPLLAPLLGAVFVLLESRIIREQRRKLPPLPPLRPFAPLVRRLALLGEAGIAASAPPSGDGSAIPAPSPAEAVPATAHAEPPSTPPPPAETPAAEISTDGGAGLGPLLKLLVGAAAVIGALALLWLIWHLLSQGLLPTPRHPAALRR
ncbi:YjbE family putative metal transport protein [Chromobacterium sp. CV08]|uniref:YjbE family putative metal transport protein n=1 Tax=Chromobacterium sp. CV08 TaxID=3133274 RepID=UPI003DA9CA0F